MLSYTALLTSAPGVTPTLLANLVNARAASDRNMTKADAREVGWAGSEMAGILGCIHASSLLAQALFA